MSAVHNLRDWVRLMCVFGQGEQDEDTALVPSLQLNPNNHGKNIQLSNRGLTISRIASYNQALVVSAQPLPRNHMFKVRGPCFKTTS